MYIIIFYVQFWCRQIQNHYIQRIYVPAEIKRGCALCTQWRIYRQMDNENENPELL